MKNLFGNFINNIKTKLPFTSKSNHNIQNEFKKTVCYSEKELYSKSISHHNMNNTIFNSCNMKQENFENIKITINEAFILHQFILDQKIKIQMGMCIIDDKTLKIYDNIDFIFKGVFSKMDSKNLKKLKRNFELVNNQVINKEAKDKLIILKSFIELFKIEDGNRIHDVIVNKDYLEKVVDNYINIKI